MGQALYRKYRPKKLEEAVGHEYITSTLKHALETGRISHAYLFTGPKGIGKTSMARILAHEINQLPYDDESMHLDIIEIDAASNRRIDEIRDLRDKVNIAPTSAKYKVYIIDEVHMLTKEAFNALLKTLEEPPAHVVFVLATTDAHKLPDTIISRTQRFTFKPVPLGKVTEHLRMIAKKEMIKVTDDALELIAAHGEGSFRDSISLLDQAGGHDGEVTLKTVQQLLGIPPVEGVQAISSALHEHDATSIINSLTSIREQGFQPKQIAKRLGETWRSHILESGRAATEDFQLLQKLLDVPAKPNPDKYLEIVLLEFALTENREQRTVSNKQQPQDSEPKTPDPPASRSREIGIPIEKKVTNDKLQITEENAKTPATTDRQLKSDSENPAPKTIKTPSESSAHPLDETTWPEVLTALKSKYNTLYGIIRLAMPAFEDNVLTLGFAFPFHKKRLSEPKNQNALAEIIRDVTGQKVAIKCVDAPREAKVAPAAAELASEAPLLSAASAPADISSISNIFGGAEVIQS